MLGLYPTVAEFPVPETGSLLEAARSGDAEAFGELCRVHETGLLRQALTLCGNYALAEDLAQDTLVDAWKCLRRYNGRCQFFTWLCAILLNRYRNTLRQKQFLSLSASDSREDCSTDDRMDQVVADNRQPDHAAQAREQAALVWKCVQALPPKHQQVIYLRFYVDNSLEGVAAALGCSVGTVKSRLFHALDKLRVMKDLPAHSENLETKGGTS